MHVSISFSFHAYISVVTGGESREALFIYVESQRVYRCYSYIYSQIKFEPIYKQWILYVMRGY
jgi:hypothetical protein